MRDAAGLIDGFLGPRLTPDGDSWLRQACDGVAEAGAGRALFMAFGASPRRVGRAAVSPTEAERYVLEAAVPGWSLAMATVDQLARARILLALPAADGASLSAALDRICADADLGELVAIYRALPLLPHPDAHAARAAEGIRSNMNAVFEAVALDNPYPAAALEEPAWNQLVLKAVFLGYPLSRVVGLRSRHNAALASALRDHVAERSAAGREIHPDVEPLLQPPAP